MPLLKYVTEAHGKFSELWALDAYHAWMLHRPHRNRVVHVLSVCLRSRCDENGAEGIAFMAASLEREYERISRQYTATTRRCKNPVRRVPDRRGLPGRQAVVLFIGT
jgi:hypothetical protein